ncbi:hypothetical protein [Streptomyces mirabilis]|uniref:hypothetical protein n=1 Tax=Streptomyces mirabilis TaxID=68239 RepID=UPI0036A9A84F
MERIYSVPAGTLYPAFVEEVLPGLQIPFKVQLMGVGIPAAAAVRLTRVDSNPANTRHVAVQCALTENGGLKRTSVGGPMHVYFADEPDARSTISKASFDVGNSQKYGGAFTSFALGFTPDWYLQVAIGAFRVLKLEYSMEDHKIQLDKSWATKEEYVNGLGGRILYAVADIALARLDGCAARFNRG